MRLICPYPPYTRPLALRLCSSRALAVWGGVPADAAPLPLAVCSPALPITLPSVTPVHNRQEPRAHRNCSTLSCRICTHGPHVGPNGSRCTRTCILHGDRVVHACVHVHVKSMFKSMSKSMSMTMGLHLAMSPCPLPRTGCTRTITRLLHNVMCAAPASLGQLNGQLPSFLVGSPATRTSTGLSTSCAWCRPR